jgi:hypothetical protein
MYTVFVSCRYGFYTHCSGRSNFHLVNTISPEFIVLTCTDKSAVKNCSKVRIACDTTETLNVLDKQLLINICFPVYPHFNLE